MVRPHCVETDVLRAARLFAARRRFRYAQRCASTSSQNDPARSAISSGYSPLMAWDASRSTCPRGNRFRARPPRGRRRASPAPGDQRQHRHVEEAQLVVGMGFGSGRCNTSRWLGRDQLLGINSSTSAPPRSSSCVAAPPSDARRIHPDGRHQSLDRDPIERHHRVQQRERRGPAGTSHGVVDRGPTPDRHPEQAAQTARLHPAGRRCTRCAACIRAADSSGTSGWRHCGLAPAPRRRPAAPSKR